MEVLGTDMIVRSPKALCTVVEERALVLLPEDSVSAELNRVGTIIWTLIEEPVSFDQIITSLLQKFDVDAEIAREEVAVLFIELQSQRLIEIRAK